MRASEDVQTASRKAGRTRSSCAECRRSKLRCDKKVPCGKCVSRGCPSICPDGVLVAGKGNRFILADTEELHAHIERLTIRVCELENALRKLQASVSTEPHPLLLAQAGNISSPTITSVPLESGPQSTEPDIGTRSRIDQDDGFVDAFGTLTLGRRGESSFFGQTARGEYLIHASKLQAGTNIDASPHRPSKLGGNQGIMLMLGTEPWDEDHRREVYRKLPTVAEAIRLCENYQSHAEYLFLPISRDELFDEILVNVYQAGSSDAKPSYDVLALLFIILALGVYYDLDRETYSVEAQEYLCLARTAIGFDSQATRLSIEAFLHIAQYLFYTDWDSTNSTSAWMYIGHAVRLGHSIGLHLNSVRWKLPERDAHRRSWTFWQAFILDTWSSFQLGRPPIMSTLYIDCPLPPDLEERVDADALQHPKYLSFNAWNVHFAKLAHSVMDTAFGATPPAYSVIGSLDRKIRDSPIPLSCRDILDDTDPLEGPVPLDTIAQRWLCLCRQETMLLHLHRAYFIQAIGEQPTDLAKHRYAPSVVAVHRSAWRLVEGLRIIWSRAPRWLARHTQAWAHGLSAAIALCQLVTRTPTSNMTPSAVAQLDILLKIFRDAERSARAAAHFSNTIYNLHRKAHEVVDHLKLLSRASLSFTPSDLDRLSGKTHLLANAGEPHSQLPTKYVGQMQAFVDMHEFQRDGEVDPNIATAGMTGNMHPIIAQDMMNFDMGSSTFNDFSDDVLVYPLSSIPSHDWRAIVSGFNSTESYQMGNLPFTSTYGDGPETHAPISDMSWHAFAD